MKTEYITAYENSARSVRMSVARRHTSERAGINYLDRMKRAVYDDGYAHDYHLYMIEAERVDIGDNVTTLSVVAEWEYIRYPQGAGRWVYIDTYEV